MEDKTNKEPDVRQQDDDIAEIDWMEILRLLWDKRKILLKAMGIGLLVGVVVALSIPKKYTVSVTLSPELGTSSNSSSLSGLSSFFGLSGYAVGEDALGVTLSADIVASTPFLLELFDISIPTEEGSDTTLVAYLDQQSVPWWSFVIDLPGKAIGAIKSLFDDEEASDTLNPFRLTKEQFRLVDALRQSIIADVNSKTYMTTLSVTLQDPVVAAVVADSVVHKLQDYIIAYRSKKAQEDCDYLEMLYHDRQKEYYEAQQKYAVYVDANQNVILQKVNAHRERLQNDMNLAYQVYSQVATQLQMARARVQESKPVFAVVEPATVPLLPSGMSRKVIVFIFVFLAFCGTAAWLLYGVDLWKKFCEEIKNPVEKKE